MNKELMRKIGAIHSLNRSENVIVRKAAKRISKILELCIPAACSGRYVELFFEHAPKRGEKCTLTLSFDCDFEEDVRSLPVVMDMLEKHSMIACFACVGRLVESFPEEHETILENNHEILNHTYTHPNNAILNPHKRFNELSQEEKKKEMKNCHEVCRKMLNYEPTGFRTPHFGGLHTNDVYPILEALGYEYSSSTIATRTPHFGIPYLEDSIIEFPLSPDPSNPFSTLTTCGIWRTQKKRYNEETYFSLLNGLLDVGVRTSASYLNLYFDPMDVVRMKNGFKGFLERLSSEESVEVRTYGGIVEKMKTYA